MYRAGCILLVGLATISSLGCVATPMTMSGGGYCGSSCGTGCDVGCSTGCNFQPCDQFQTGGLLDTGCQEGCGFGSNLAGLANLSSCRGACGDVYVDEWINEPPVVDNCGYGCDCGTCDACCPRPVLTILKRLWGRRYIASCDSAFMCGGCDSCYAGGSVAESCGCAECQSGGVVMEGGAYLPGEAYSEPSYASPPAQYQPAPQAMPGLDGSTVSPEVIESPSAVPATPTAPTPAPQVSPTSRRINPAARRRGYSST